MSLLKLFVIIWFLYVNIASCILTKPQWKLIEKTLQHPNLTPEIRLEIEQTIFHHHIPLAKKMCNDFGLKHLSMGMSSDYKTAIRHGATYVRVGTGIFGKRG